MMHRPHAHHFMYSQTPKGAQACLVAARRESNHG